MGNDPTFVEDRLLRVGDVEFHCDYPLPAPVDGRLSVMKPRALVDRCIRLAAELQPRRMVELGIKHGGSTALWAALLEPEKLVALELTAEPGEMLGTFIRQRCLTEVVRPYYGVDHADSERVAEIVDSEFALPLDLVFDDASHLYGPTRASFEVLFPRLRPGGVYVIEDWSDRHLIADGFLAKLTDATADRDETMRRLKAGIEAQYADGTEPDTPLTQLAVELLVARASRGDLFRAVTAEADWIIVTKGDDPIGPGPFRLDDHITDHEGFLAIPPPAFLRALG